MKKKEYVKPAVETIEINGETIMQTSINMNVSEEDPITNNSGMGAKQNTFDVWE